MERCGGSLETDNPDLRTVGMRDRKCNRRSVGTFKILISILLESIRRDLWQIYGIHSSRQVTVSLIFDH